MNYAWIGTPKVLHSLTNADGEASYNRTLDEMFVISSVLVVSGYALLRCIAKRRFQNPGN
jgi:hypothetical protein